MDYGMPTLIECRSLEENVKLCKELGLQFLELNMNLPEYQLHAIDMDYLKQQKDIYYTIHLDENLNVCDFNELVAAAYFETARQTIEIAKELKAPILNMHLSEGVHFTLPDHKEYLFETYKQYYLGQMEKFRDACDTWIGDSDITICLENCDGFKGFHREAIKLMCQSRNFALTLDVGHDYTSGNGDLDYILSMKRLKHMHLHDANDMGCHLELGNGNVSINEMIKLAEDEGARIVLEVKTIEGLKKSVEYIRKQV